MIRYIKPREAIAILEKKPELLLDKNRLNKFFADEKLMLNDSDVNNVYSILKDNELTIEHKIMSLIKSLKLG